MIFSNLAEARKQANVNWHYYKHGKIISYSSDPLHYTSSRFYIGQLISECGDYWLIEDDVWCEIFNSKTEDIISLNIEDEDVMDIVNIWNFMTGQKLTKDSLPSLYQN